MGKFRPLAVLTVALMTTGLAACGGSGGTGSAAAPAGSPEKIKLTVALFSDFKYAPLYEDFKKTHPNVEIVERRAQFDDHHKNLITQLATGAGAADVVAVEVGYIGTFTPLKDKFYNLLDYGLGRRQSEYLDWKWKQGMSNDGTALLGLGTDVGGLAMCYRTDLFEKAGLPSDRDEVARLWPTWDDYLAMGRKFAAAKVPGAKFVDGPGEIFRAIVNQAPQGLYDDQDHIIAATNPDVKKAYDLSVRLVQDGLSAKLTAFTPPWNTGFAKGGFATVICPAWMTGYITDQAKNAAGKWDIAAVPGGGGGNSGGTHLMLPRQGKHPKEAAELIDFLTGKESQARLFRDAGALPSLPALYDDPAIADLKKPYFNDAPFGKIFTDSAKALKPVHLGPKEGEVRGDIGRALERVEQGKQSPAEAWALARKDIQ
jgi:cellobiose transport system substrate-binding protein